MTVGVQDVPDPLVEVAYRGSQCSVLYEGGDPGRQAGLLIRLERGGAWVECSLNEPLDAMATNAGEWVLAGRCEPGSSVPRVLNAPTHAFDFEASSGAWVAIVGRPAGAEFNVETERGDGRTYRMSVASREIAEELCPSPADGAAVVHGSDRAELLFYDQQRT